MIKVNLKWGFWATCNSLLLPQLALAKNPQPVVEPKNPNVLFIVVDDWGASDLSCKGSKFYETPNIDKLSEQSVNFNNAYVAYPRSAPSRYSLWTGMHCARPEKMEKGTAADERKIGKETYCIPEPFKAAGYNTFFIGKWHLATDDCLPQDKGFDINIGGGKAGATSSHFAPFNQNAHGKEAPIVGMDDAAPGEYLTDYMTRKVVDYIKSEHKKPFLAVCSFYAVHTPIQAKPETIEKYKNKRAAMGLMEDNYIPEEAGVRKAQQNNEVYAAMIESVDIGVGKMIEALKESGQFDNTVIVLISDNGGLSNRGLNKRELATNNDPYKAGKGHLYEGGIRVPLFIHLPGQTTEKNSNVLVAGYDLFPTVADLCHVTLASGVKLDGISMKTAIQGKPTKEIINRDLYWHKASERPTQTGDYLSSAIRSGNYKLIDFYQQNRVELYDLSKDPGETKNLASELPDVTKKLLQKVRDWRKTMNVNMPDPEKQKRREERMKEKNIK